MLGIVCGVPSRRVSRYVGTDVNRSRALRKMLSSSIVTAVTRGASGALIQLLKSGKTPTKATDKSEALDRTSMPVGIGLLVELGAIVIPDGSGGLLEVDAVLLKTDGGFVKPALGGSL